MNQSITLSALNLEGVNDFNKTSFIPEKSDITFAACSILAKRNDQQETTYVQLRSMEKINSIPEEELGIPTPLQSLYLQIRYFVSLHLLPYRKKEINETNDRAEREPLINTLYPEILNSYGKLLLKEDVENIALDYYLEEGADFTNANFKLDANSIPLVKDIFRKTQKNNISKYTVIFNASCDALENALKIDFRGKLLTRKLIEVKLLEKLLEIEKSAKERKFDEILSALEEKYMQNSSRIIIKNPPLKMRHYRIS